MRHHDQINDEHPDVVKSDPVPVPPPDRDPDGPDGLDSDRTDADATAGPDRGSFDHDPVLADGTDAHRADGTDGDRTDDADGDRTDTVTGPDDTLTDRGSFDDPVLSDGTDADRTDEDRADADLADENRADADLADEDRADTDLADEDRADEDRFGADRTDTNPGAHLDDRLDEARDNDPLDDDPVPGDRTAETAVDAPLDGPAATDEQDRDGWDRGEQDPDRTVFADPAPQPTAFGAGTPGGAVAASAMAGEGRPTEHDVDEVDADRTADGALAGDGLAVDPADRDGDGVPDRAETTGRYDDGLTDDGLTDDSLTGDGLTGDGLTDEDRGFADRGGDDREDWLGPTGTGTGEPVDTADTTGSDGAGLGAAGLAGAAAGAAGAGALAAGRHEAGEPDAADRVASTPAGGVGTDSGLLPGAVPTEPVTALFGADRATDFRNRWRDVQLRFVDDPKSAVGDAQGLVEEAIEALAAALASQKDELSSWRQGDSHDTEQLRVLVRRYRDFLDRVVDL
ncbi:hypothetical protein ACFFWC_27630 [Plantactinospora siamensis]|uniref:Uncharacterized protein n=1 Tax=Plantactinospora siamensis TaxID=555372 RepID=A0ABV6NXT8_9ACTN